MASLAEIRAKLLASQQNNKNSSGGDNQVYKHWDIPDGSTTTLRFLPDGNKANTYFWVEKAVIKMPFAGIKGETNSKPVTVQVPCMETWGESCPILTEVRPWYKTKDKDLETLANTYWKKRSYIFQGFVVDNKLPGDVVPENPIRRFIVNPQIFPIIISALTDNEIEEVVTDEVRGLDFRICKTTKGKYADYTSSNWARRERALSENELSAIQQHGLFNLSDYLPKKPGEVELKVIKKMFEASVKGDAFDMELWGSYYKPSGASRDSTPSATTTSVETANQVDNFDDELPFEPSVSPVSAPSPETSSAGSRAADILATIRSRSKQ
jgi:hypothetical protein